MYFSSGLWNNDQAIYVVFLSSVEVISILLFYFILLLSVGTIVDIWVASDLIILNIVLRLYEDHKT